MPLALGLPSRAMNNRRPSGSRASAGSSPRTCPVVSPKSHRCAGPAIATLKVRKISTIPNLRQPDSPRSRPSRISAIPDFTTKQVSAYGAERNPRTHPTMRPSSARAQEGETAGLDAIVSAYSLRRTAAAPSERDPLLSIFLGLRSRSTPGLVLLRLRRSMEFDHFSSWGRGTNGT